MMPYKRGNIMGILLIVGGLMLLLLVGVGLAFGSATINWVMDEVVPELTGIGMVGEANVTHAVEVTIVPVNNFIQQFTWVSGLLFLFGLIGLFGLANAYRSTGDKWLIGFFMVAVLLLIITSIFMSNIYEDVYNGNDVFAGILHEHVILSWFIIFAPAWMSILSFLAGILLFSGEEGGGF